MQTQTENNLKWCKQGPIYRSAITATQAKRQRQGTSNTISKVWKGASPKPFHLLNANTVQVSRSGKDREVVPVFFSVPTGVRLLHVLTIEADFTHVHATAPLVHSLQLDLSTERGRQRRKLLGAQHLSLVHGTESCLFLMGTIKPLLFVEGVSGQQGVRLALKLITAVEGALDRATRWTSLSCRLSGRQSFLHMLWLVVDLVAQLLVVMTSTS